jgi:hypothetical protein
MSLASAKSADLVAIALPDVQRHLDLLARVDPTLRQLGIGVYLVTKNGSVDERLSPASLT